MKQIADTGRLAALFVPLFACALLLSACGAGAGLDGFKVSVDTPVTASSLEISTRNVPMAHVDAAYPAFQLEATGATSSVNWTLDAGTLPAGMALYPSGHLTGTPVDTGLFPITVRASDGVHEDTQALLVSVDAFGVMATDGLHFGEAWSGDAVTLSTAGNAGPVDYEIVNDETQGHLSGTTYFPGSAGGPDATVTIRATDRNTGAQADIELVVQPHPAASHVARFGVTDVWYLDFQAKRGVHPFTSDTHAAWAALGLRDRASIGSLGTEADQLADFLARRAVLESMNRHFLRNEDGTAGAEGLGISFPMARPDSQHAVPAPGASLAGSPTRYSLISVCDSLSRAGLGAAVVDLSTNPNHNNNSAGSGLGELGVFINTAASSIRNGYRLYERELIENPVNDDDLPTLRALLHGQDIAQYGERGEDIRYTIWAIGRSIAVVASHEIAHSCGLVHNLQTQPGALMNYAAAIHPSTNYAFLPENVAALRAALPGPGRYGGHASKPGTAATLAAQAKFLGGGGLCVCHQK